MPRICSLQSLYVTLAVVACVALCIPLQNKASDELLNRKERSLYQFGNMVNCMTNRSRFSYINYGCWCGVGGKGEPVDEVDKCCKIHDKCYDSITYTKCSYSFYVYAVIYKYQGCRQCDPISSYPWWENWLVNVECKNAVCECDSAAALCLSLALYNASYFNYDVSNC